MTLFDLSDIPVPPPQPAESAQRRLTRTNNALIAHGVHPATRTRIAAELGTCGDCDHAHRYEYHNGAWWKCDLHRLGQSHSANSDLRISWPACQHHTPKEDR